MNLKCYIVDDEFHSVEILINYIEQTDGLELQGYSTNPLIALNEVTGSNPPDLTFLDIEMPELSGMEFAGLASLYTTIVFTTSFREFALEAFEEEAFDFLLKPVGYTRFRKCIQRARKKYRQQESSGTRPRDFFFVRSETRGKMLRISIPDILYIEGAKNYIKIHTTTGVMMPYLTIAEIEEYLPAAQFSRIHQSFIINLSKIKTVEPAQVTLENNIAIRLGRSYKDPFLKKMNELLLTSKRSVS